MNLNFYVVYYIHDDGDTMYFMREETNPNTHEPRVSIHFTPYHRLSTRRMPHLFATLAKARRYAEEEPNGWIENSPPLHVAEWRGLAHAKLNQPKRIPTP